MTQQSLADLLHVSNKTISRYETGEGYPDIETLKNMAEIFGVSTDYLLSDQKNSRDLNKLDIVSYFPWIIGIGAVFIYYLFVSLSIPSIVAFIVYATMIKCSSHFLHTYTDKRNGKNLVWLNTISSFFVVQNITILIFVVRMTGSFPFGGDISLDGFQDEVMGWIAISYFASLIYAMGHYIIHSGNES